MWNKLSMKDKAKYIKLAIENGVTNRDDIIDAYNSYAEGGQVDSTIEWVDPTKKGTSDYWLGAMRKDDDGKLFQELHLAYNPNDTYIDRRTGQVISNADIEDTFDELGTSNYSTPQRRYLTEDEIDEYNRITAAEIAAKRDKESQLPFTNFDVRPGNTAFEKMINQAIASNANANRAFEREYGRLNDKEIQNITGFQNYIDDRLNTYTGGLWHLALPSHDMGMVREAFSGQGINAFNPFDSNSAYWDNSGIFSEEFNQEHPFLSSLTNAGVDIFGFNKFNKVTGINKIPNTISDAFTETLRFMSPKLFHSKPGAYFADMLHPFKTIRAILDDRYLPLMSKAERAEFIDKLYERIDDTYRPAARRRYSERKRVLEENGLSLPYEGGNFTVNDVPIELNYKKDLLAERRLPNNAVGIADNKGVALQIDNVLQPNVIMSDGNIFSTVSHELDHINQDNLWDKRFVWNDRTNKNRFPIYERDLTYYSIPSHRENTFLTEYSTAFDKLSDRTRLQKSNTTSWHNSPGEVQSEAAAFIDNSGNLGKTFKELEAETAKEVVNKIADRFSISRKNAEKMLKQASEEGYLANGGPLNNSLSVFNSYTPYNPANTGMMKAKLALASHFGNTTARRMTNYDTRSYTFTGQEKIDGEQAAPKGAKGNVYVSSWDNLVTPQIQDINGQLQFIEDPWSGQNADRSYRQSMIFDTPEDARYFGEWYKEIAPMTSLYYRGGY